MNLANFITAIRIFLGPVFIYCFLAESPTFKIAAFVIIIVSEISDIMDGYLARKYQAVTTVGKLLDPLADSIFRFSVFLAFLVSGYAQIWMVAIIFYRDSVVSWIRAVAASRNKIVSARTSGKIKAWVQGIAAVAIVALAAGNWWSVSDLKEISFWLMTIATIVTAASGCDYFIANYECLRSPNQQDG